jgi:hypothetical protein
MHVQWRVSTTCEPYLHVVQRRVVKSPGDDNLTQESLSGKQWSLNME